VIIKIFLLITAVIYGGLGGWALLDPASFVDEVGLTINSNLGSSEIRSVYGGINLLIGLFAFAVLFQSKHEELFMKILIFVILGILLGRAVSLIFGELNSAFLWGFTAFELVWFITLYIHLNQMKKKIF
jgi:hypothetical protein|tara:strand:- start:354 stop:740 length:387 start_codon:yes stop_codon:yes gene_type:complete